MTAAQLNVSAAALAITLKRIPGHRRAKEQEVVEVRQCAFCAPAADVVNTGLGRTLYGRDSRAVESGRLAQTEPGARVGVEVDVSHISRHPRCRRESGTANGQSHIGYKHRCRDRRIRPL